MCFWMNRNDVGNPRPIFSFQSGDSPELFGLYYLRNKKQFHFYVRDEIYKLHVEMKAHKWVHLCITWVGVDTASTLVALHWREAGNAMMKNTLRTGKSMAALPSVPGHFKIGGGRYNQAFSGSLANVNVYSRRLSALEMDSLFKSICPINLDDAEIEWQSFEGIQSASIKGFAYHLSGCLLSGRLPSFTRSGNIHSVHYHVHGEYN